MRSLSAYSSGCCTAVSVQLSCFMCCMQDGFRAPGRITTKEMQESDGKKIDALQKKDLLGAVERANGPAVAEYLDLWTSRMCFGVIGRSYSFMGPNWEVINITPRPSHITGRHTAQVGG